MLRKEKRVVGRWVMSSKVHRDLERRVTTREGHQNAEKSGRIAGKGAVSIKVNQKLEKE